MSNIDEFVRDLRSEVHVMLRDGVAEVEARQEAHMKRWAGVRGMTFATGSFSVQELHGRLHLNFPSALADEETVGAVMGLVEEIGLRHQVGLDVSLKVRGGSNFVLEGRLYDAPSIAP